MIPFYAHKFKLAFNARKGSYSYNQLRDEQGPWNPPSLWKTMPSTRVAITRRSSLLNKTYFSIESANKSIFERQMELEEHLMKNPLTRGKGFKAVKIVKTLIGTNSFYDVIEKAQAQRTARHQLLKSPERELGHIIKERKPGPGVRMREWRIGNIGESSGSTTGQAHSITEIMNLLFPCLYVGCFIWWASEMPEIIQALNQYVARLLDTEELKEALSAASQDTGETSTGREIVGVAKGEKNEGTKEMSWSAPEERSVRAIAIWIGGIALAIALGLAASKAAS